jgi:hypothetical protein
VIYNIFLYNKKIQTALFFPSYPLATIFIGKPRIAATA